MKNGTKRALITATVCTVAGLCIMLLALACIGFQIKEVGGMKTQTNTHPIQEPFSAIDIKTVSADVSILPAEDGVCRVECRETDKITHTVAVEGGRLTVREKDDRRWFERLGFFGFSPLAVTLYLPEETYGPLTVSTVSGKIELSDALCFGNTVLCTTSGSITSPAKVNGSLTATTVSGSVSLSRQSGGEVRASTTSGSITLSGIQATTLSASTTSGSITMTDATAAAALRAESVSGRLSLTRVDGAQISLSTVSGGITASLRTGKTFSHSTVSGKVDLPPSVAGAGPCHVETVSGSIRVTVEEA